MGDGVIWSIGSVFGRIKGISIIPDIHFTLCQCICEPYGKWYTTNGINYIINRCLNTSTNTGKIHFYLYSCLITGHRIICCRPNPWCYWEWPAIILTGTYSLVNDSIGIKPAGTTIHMIANLTTIMAKVRTKKLALRIFFQNKEIEISPVCSRNIWQWIYFGHT